VFAELMEFAEVGRHLSGMVSGLDLRYDVGPGDHPLLGRRIPNGELLTAEGKTTTVSLLHQGRGVLLDLAAQPRLLEVAAPWQERIDIVASLSHELLDGTPLADTTGVLIRPDGYVLWVAPDAAAASPDDDGLLTALSRWFGCPTVHSQPNRM
jgi:bifunctional hydroxylase/dehydrase